MENKINRLIEMALLLFVTLTVSTIAATIIVISASFLSAILS